jgi:hypothetical protein
MSPKALCARPSVMVVGGWIMGRGLRGFVFRSREAVTDPCSWWHCQGRLQA